MDSLETNDIKAHYFFLTEGLCKWKFHIFMDIFALSWIFFPLPGLTQGKMPHFLHRRYLEGLYLCCGLVSPAKEWQFMSIHGAPEPKSER